MSLYQCEKCGCCENTSLGWYWYTKGAGKEFDRKLCSACAPDKFDDGSPTGLGKWHGEFEREYYPLGTMGTDENGNLAPINSVPKQRSKEVRKQIYAHGAANPVIFEIEKKRRKWPHVSLSFGATIGDVKYPVSFYTIDNIKALRDWLDEQIKSYEAVLNAEKPKRRKAKK